MINNEADRKKINDALQEASNSMTRIDAEKDLIKTILTDLSDTFQLPKKTVNKLARIYHKQNFNQEAQEFEDLETLYEEVVKLVP
jgi:hypothetical protein